MPTINTSAGELDISENGLAELRNLGIDENIFATWFNVIRKKLGKSANAGHVREYIDEDGGGEVEVYHKSLAAQAEEEVRQRAKIYGMEGLIRAWVERRFGYLPTEFRVRISDSLAATGLPLTASGADSLLSHLQSYCSAEAQRIHQEGQERGTLPRTPENENQFIFNICCERLYAEVPERFNGRMVNILSKRGAYNPIRTTRHDIFLALLFALDIDGVDKLIPDADWDWLGRVKDGD